MFSLLRNGRLSDLLKPLTGFGGSWIVCPRFRIKVHLSFSYFSNRFIVDIKALGSNGFCKKWSPSDVLAVIGLVSIVCPLVRRMRAAENCC